MIEYQKKINESWCKVESKKRKCMYKDCNDKAIKSHVLQKNGIIREISENNHLIHLARQDGFKLLDEGICNFQRVGVNDVYTFKGFCDKHDSEVFHIIENENKIDFFAPQQQALFCYRGLCQEIRRKEQSIEFAKALREKFPLKFEMMTPLINGFYDGLSNLNFFKRELEYSIENNDYDKFHFSTVKILKIDICISVPLNIGELKNSELPYEEWKSAKKIPFTTSFINIFPYKKESFFIAGFHKDFPCKWTESKIRKFGFAKDKVIKKELSDLIVLRLEFWAMSPKLFRTIPKVTLDKYKRTFSENVLNHSEKLKTKINLFKSI